VPPLDCDTVLFDASRNAVGVVFEVFGPVTRPCYTMRFDTADDLQESALCPGVDVFFAPTKAEWTRAVFTDALLK
jgi:rRNA processing protein Gar1